MIRVQRKSPPQVLLCAGWFTLYKHATFLQVTFTHDELVPFSDLTHYRRSVAVTDNEGRHKRLDYYNISFCRFLSSILVKPCFSSSKLDQAQHTLLFIYSSSSSVSGRIESTDTSSTRHTKWLSGGIRKSLFPLAP